MNRRTCVVSVTVQPDGNVVLDSRTIVAYPNGCSAMVKTIAVITATNCQKIVHLVTAKLTLSAQTTVVFQSK